MKKKLLYSATALGAVAVIGTSIASAHQLNLGRRDLNDTQVEAPGQFQAHHEQMLASFADILGISQQDLQAELDAGKNLPEIAQEQNVDLEALRQTMESQRQQFMQERLDALVAGGNMTQEEADAHIAHMQEMQDFRASNGFGRGMGPRGPMGTFSPDQTPQTN